MKQRDYHLRNMCRQMPIRSIYCFTLAAASPFFPSKQLVSLFAQGDPDPEPGNGLNEHECKEYTVLEAITSPGSRHMVRKTSIWPGSSIERRGSAEEERIEEQAHRYEEAHGCCAKRQPVDRGKRACIESHLASPSNKSC